MCNCWWCLGLEEVGVWLSYVQVIWTPKNILALLCHCSFKKCKIGFLEHSTGAHTFVTVDFLASLKPSKCFCRIMTLLFYSLCCAFVFASLQMNTYVCVYIKPLLVSSFLYGDLVSLFSFRIFKYLLLCDLIKGKEMKVCLVHFLYNWPLLALRD